MRFAALFKANLNYAQCIARMHCLAWLSKFTSSTKKKAQRNATRTIWISMVENFEEKDCLIYIDSNGLDWCYKRVSFFKHFSETPRYWSRSKFPHFFDVAGTKWSKLPVFAKIKELRTLDRAFVLSTETRLAASLFGRFPISSLHNYNWRHNSILQWRGPPPESHVTFDSLQMPG